MSVDIIFFFMTSYKPTEQEEKGWHFIFRKYYATTGGHGCNGGRMIHLFSTLYLKLISAPSHRAQSSSVVAEIRV